MGPNEVEDATAEFNSRLQIVSPPPAVGLPADCGNRAERHEPATIQIQELQLLDESVEIGERRIRQEASS
jgi:hypothetical protein